jgi:hypothetical protein
MLRKHRFGQIMSRTCIEREPLNERVQVGYVPLQPDGLKVFEPPVRHIAGIAIDMF